jgi:hypothetical protein
MKSLNRALHRNALAAALLFTLVELLANKITGTPIPLQHWLWLTISALMTSYVLTVYAFFMTSNDTVVRFIRLLTISFIVGCVSILIEALIFKVTTVTQTLVSMGAGLARFFVLSAILAYLFRHVAPPGTPPQSVTRTTWSWIWRISSTTVLYIIVYFVAGIILQASLPALGEFYQGKIPPISTIFITQVGRGLMLSLIGLFFVRTCTLPVVSRAVLLGMLFSVLGGVAPLIQPNELMPVVLRIGHGFEVGLSNFLYGYLVGRILAGKGRTANDSRA